MKWSGLLAMAMIVAATAVQSQAAVVINFDDLTAPSLFVNQVALAEEYASLGVHFSGTGEVLNSDSNFGVSLSPPFTPRNFLAWNSSVGSSPPETITFDYLISSLSLNFAGSTGTIFLSGYLGNSLVNTVSLNSASSFDWSLLTLTGGTYDRVVFDASGTNGAFVVDNIVFERSAAAVPEPASVAMWGLGALGLIAVRRRKSLLSV